MTTISKDAQLITLINVFTVDPRISQACRASHPGDRHLRLESRAVLSPRGFTEAVIVPLSRCMRTGVVLTTQTMRRDPGPTPYLQEALTIAKFEPGIYDVVESFAPPSDEI